MEEKQSEGAEAIVLRWVECLSGQGALEQRPEWSERGSYAEVGVPSSEGG